jgi:pilus assembly protein CpaB
MRAIFALVLIVGMGLAGMAVYMIQGYISQTETLLEQERAFNQKAGNLVEVFVYNKPLKYGDALTQDDVAVIYWPEQALPAGIFRDGTLLFPENAPGPRYIMRNAEAFEPILESRVTAPGELAGLTAKLGKGMRAFQITVGVASGVAGFVQPDDFIDIYWTGTINGVEQTRLIESSMQIIAVDDSFNTEQVVGASDAGTITVAVTPEKVARLTQAQATGRLTMSLVGQSSDATTENIEVDTNTLLGIEEAAPVVEAPAPAAEKVCTIKSRKGSDVVETVIPCNDGG